jgi:hypothetical protein
MKRDGLKMMVCATPLALAEFLGGSVSSCRLLQLRSHSVALARLVQLDEYTKGAS